MTRIAILGAESTGKTRLAEDIASHLRASGVRSVAVPEVRREWCLRAARSPRPEEQLAIAQEQERRVDAAAASHDIVVADTTALMVAIHAGMPFEAGALLRFALERQRTYDATLVTGLDLPCVPDGLQRDPSRAREPVDALLRTLLQRAQAPFQVVYGSGPQRLRSALAALACSGAVPAALGERPPEDNQRRAWTWLCDKCSDPACEHRLFTRLRAGRAGS